MKKTILTLCAMMLMAVGAQAEDHPSKCCKQANPYQKYTKDLPFSMPEVKAPEFPDNHVNLADFGAVGIRMSLEVEQPSGREFCIPDQPRHRLR